MANTKTVKPKQIKIRDRVLLVCSHGECTENRVWDFDTCWEHLTSTEKQTLRERLYTSLRSGEDLSGIILTGANLEGLDFTGVNLAKSFLNGCNLSSC